MKPANAHNKLADGFEPQPERALVHYCNSDPAELHLPLQRPFIAGSDRLSFITAGSMVVNINMHTVHLGRGQLLYSMHGSIVEVVSESPDLELLSVALLATPMGTAHPHHRVFEAQEPLKSRIAMYFNILTSMSHECVQVLEPLHRALLADVFGEGQVLESAQSRTHEQELFNRFIELVAEHAVAERAVAFYARSLSLSASRLMGLVKGLSGRTVLQWVNLRIVQQAKALLMYSDKSVSQVAMELGMMDANYFSRFFRKETGCSPTEFRHGQR